MVKRMIFAVWWALALSAAVELKSDPAAGPQVTLETSASGIELSRFHRWILRLPPGPPVKAVHFDASMPAHGHGLADQPRLYPASQPAARMGRVFEIEGVRFQMSGAWTLRVRYEDATNSYSVLVPFEVRYTSNELRSLWLGSRGPIRADATNRFADHPEAAALGKELFFDVRLSGDGKVSCATCHQPELAFADQKRFSRPGATRNTPGLLGVSDALWFFWDGRRDSLWSQALSPIESPVEMGGSRRAVADLLRGTYRQSYERVTGAKAAELEVDRLFADAGKFLAAYQRTLQPKASRLDRYIEDLEAGRASDALTGDEVAGLKLFLSPEARCKQCHNGPLLTNQGFHNIGTAKLDGDQPDFGRAMGIQALPYDPFNCRSPYSDQPTACGALDHARPDGHDGLLTGAYKVPSLRNVALTAPYFHDGSRETLEAVIEHYRHPPKASELRPLEVSDRQATQLVAFLRALTGL